MTHILRTLWIRNLVCSILATCLLGSCASNPEGAAAAVGGLTTAVLKLAGVDDRTAYSVGIGAGVLTWAISKKYQMDQRQQAIAMERARVALRNTPKSQRYVAVPVPKRNRSQAGPRSDLAVVDRQTGQLVNDKAYETTKAEQTRNNAPTKVGNYKTVVYNTFQGA